MHTSFLFFHIKKNLTAYTIAQPVKWFKLKPCTHHSSADLDIQQIQGVSIDYVFKPNLYTQKAETLWLKEHKCSYLPAAIIEHENNTKLKQNKRSMINFLSLSVAKLWWMYPVYGACADTFPVSIKTDMQNVFLKRIFAIGKRLRYALPAFVTVLMSYIISHRD